MDNDACLCGKAARDHWQGDESPFNSQDAMVCDHEDMTANRRASGNLSIMKK
ncbi:MAG TPA: hypothetical protein VJ854_05180 [Sphaerochaeta sp.]|nr:hypothetical protein [Sphaerochaeta sp.]